MNSFRIVAWAAGAALALFTLTSAMTSLAATSPAPATPPPAASVPAAPTLSVSVARGDSFPSPESMRRDFNAMQISIAIAEFRARHADDFAPEELRRMLLDDGWNVASIDPTDYRYIYVIDPNGHVREICLDPLTLVVSDGAEVDLQVNLTWEVEL